MRASTAPRRDPTFDILHGVEVADPYRWMEDPDDPELRSWIASQQDRFDDAMDADVAREEIREQLGRIWDYPKVGIPFRRGTRWFQQRNSGVQQQAVLWTMAEPDGEGRVLLDPNTLSEDGTLSLAGVAVAPDGMRIAYGVSDGGSDWITWHVRDVATGQDLPDIVRWGKFSGAAWLEDCSGFFYGAYDEPADGAELQAANRGHKLMFKPLGGEAVLVHARPDDPELGFSPVVTEDGRWLVVSVWRGTNPTNMVALADLSTASDPSAVELDYWLDADDASYDVIGNDGDTMLVQTDLDASSGRLLAIDARDATSREELLAEDSSTLHDVHWIGGRLLVVRLRDAAHELVLHERDGTVAGLVELPDLASVTGISGRAEDQHAYLGCSSFTASSATLRLDVQTGTVVETRSPHIRLEEVSTSRVMVASSDGTDVPMFVIRNPDHAGPQRTILYGYGGFGIPLSPEFRLWWTVWLARGGAIAVGCYRGGLEYGRRWHDDGRLANKQRTFDDAASCASWLGEQDWTTAAHVAITGGSNGGLTAAMTMLQRPELFGACVPEVGVLDLLRFQKFTIGWAWRSDYGDPEQEADFRWILPISPYHQIEEGREYPATLVVTADRDDRVVPAHSFKFLAALQHAQGGDAPIVGRIDTRAGHGAGTPTSKLIAARADVMAFLEQVLGAPEVTEMDPTWPA